MGNPPIHDPAPGAQPSELPYLLPPDENLDRAGIERYGRQCFMVGVYNERAAALMELDRLAREFDAAGRPNTVKRLRELAARIDARLR